MLEVVEEAGVEEDELVLEVLLLLNTVQALLGSAAVVLEVESMEYPCAMLVACCNCLLRVMFCFLLVNSCLLCEI